MLLNMEMKANYLGDGRMFNFEELYARIHELDGIKDPTPEELARPEWDEYVRGIVQDAMTIGSENYSMDLGEWPE